MLNRRLRWFIPVVLMMVFSTLCRADIPPEIVAEGKRATAMVEVGGGRAFGSAFCIDPSGYFVTNAHVVTSPGKPTITLVLHAGEWDQQRLEAAVVRRDNNLDLAILFAKPTKPLTSLSLGIVDDLVETAGVAAFGYPLGRDLTRSDGAYPGIVVTVAHITSLRRVGGALDGIQLDSARKPGNAGGPVLNVKGKVIGVVTAGASELGATVAIPVSDLRRFMNTADIILTPPDITTANARSPLEFGIQVKTFPHPIKGMSVEVNLTSGSYDHRTAMAKLGENQTVTLKMSPLPASIGPHMLRLTVEDSESRVVCTSPDQTILVSGKHVLLSSLHEIEPGSPTIVTLPNNARREENVSGLESIEMHILGKTTRQNLSRAKRITIEDVDSPTSSVAYHIVARQAGRAIGELNGEIVISGSHAPRVVSDWTEKSDMLVCCYFSNAVKRFNGRTGAFIDDFITGSGLTGPTAIVAGPDGNLYVTGGDSQTVHRFSGRTGQFINIFVPKDGYGAISAPNGMAFGPDGNLYVGSFNGRAVKRYNGQTGAFIDTFVSAGSGGLNQPGYLMFGPDGNLLVACVAGRSIKRYDGKTGAYLGDFLNLNGNTNPNGFCYGPDGRFYVCCYRSKSIQRFDGKTGAFIDSFIGPEELNGKEPVGIAFGPDSNLYISTRGDEIRRFDGSTGMYIDTFLSGSDIRFPQYMIFRPSPAPRQASR